MGLLYERYSEYRSYVHAYFVQIFEWATYVTEPSEIDRFYTFYSVINI